MKKKNNKKLARNAIRARKAVKKRENEQNTPKQRKRIATRIASLIGCLLLVSALVVPCFADPISDYVVTDAFYENFNEYVYDNVQNDAYRILIDAYQNGSVDQGASNQFVHGLFDCNVLFTSNIFVTQQTVEFGLTNSDPVVLDYDFTAEYLVICFDTENVNYRMEAEDVSVLLEYYLGSDEPYSVLNVYDSVSGMEFYLYYDAYYNESGAYSFYLNTVEYYINGSPIWTVSGSSALSAIDNMCVALTVESPRTIDYHALNYFYTLIQGNVVSGYSVYDPYSWVQGFLSSTAGNEYWTWLDGYNAGMDAGYDIGHDAGYSEGYENGFADGYDAGVSDIPDMDENEAFENGYQAALNDIESGDFGRNLLGGFFSAPLEAIQGFTLVNWETANGDVISISIGTILSAIVGLGLLSWFLKLFAGG